MIPEGEEDTVVRRFFVRESNQIWGKEETLPAPGGQRILMESEEEEVQMAPLVQLVSSLTKQNVSMAQKIDRQ